MRTYNLRERMTPLRRAWLAFLAAADYRSFDERQGHPGPASSHCARIGWETLALYDRQTGEVVEREEAQRRHDGPSCERFDLIGVTITRKGAIALLRDMLERREAAAGGEPAEKP